jgi:gluconolactonase
MNFLAVASLGVLGATVAFGPSQALLSAQARAPASRQGPGVQAAADAREPEVLAKCRNPPPAPGNAGRGPAAAGVAGPGGAPAQAAVAAPARGAGGGGNAGPRDYTVTAIAGVVAAGQQWKVLWSDTGNNADGIVGTDDGGLLIARNDKSDVVKLDKDGKVSSVYMDTNTGGALSINSKGELFIAERALNPAIWQLAPRRRLLANKYDGDPLDCLGGVLNDIQADSKGGVYFTMAGLGYADSKGVITRYGDKLRTNGIILSPDEKTLYVTNAGTLAAFDVQPDGSLKNQREFVTLQGGGGDGSTVDAAGRIYVTGGPGVHVVGSDGRYLGAIPTPRGVISVAFGGPDKKTLYAVATTNDGGRGVQIIAIQTIAQGYKGRAK